MAFHASDWAIKQNPSQNDYTGIIVGINDPLKDNRAQVRVPFLHTGVPDEFLPWYRNGNIQMNVKGSKEIKLPILGATVKVAFENDDFYTGTFYNGYTDTSNNSTDSFLEDYGTFDGFKDQWGNTFKKTANGFTYSTKDGVILTVNGTVLNIAGVSETSLSGNLNVLGNINVSGSANIVGEVIGNSIPLSTHIHGGVQSGDEKSSTPEAS